MVALRKEQGDCSIGSYRWERDGDVVEVDDELAYALLAIPGGGFTVHQPGDSTAASAGDSSEGSDGDASPGGGAGEPDPDEAEASVTAPAKTRTRSTSTRSRTSGAHRARA